MPTNTPANETDLSDAILGKADALIRRNRPDGVSSEAEELPLLTEVVDEIPSLNDFLTTPGGSYASGANAPAVATDPRQSVVIGLSQDQVNILINDAVDRAQRDILKHQDRVVQEAIERARSETAVAHASAVQAALAKGRAEGKQEGQTQGIAEGLARGRAENQAMQQAALDTIRRDTHQAVVLQFSEQLIELDAYIAQSVDAWLGKELPQIVAGEIESFVERLKSRTAAHMRATLLPDISNKLSALLDTPPR